MKTIVNKTIVILIILFISFSNIIIYATMADFTDEEADKITKQNQEEWKHEQEERINKSSNNYLKSLTVENYNITPEFDKQTINYEIKEEINEKSIEIKAETDDEKSSVSGIGKVTLNSGENNLRIDVTAENGTVRTYFIKVIFQGDSKEEVATTNDSDVAESDSYEKSDSYEESALQETTVFDYKKIAVIISALIIVSIFLVVKLNKKNRHGGKHS